MQQNGSYSELVWSLQSEYETMAGIVLSIMKTHLAFRSEFGIA
jgi:hypothetical protein